jgi:hypothetical protein
MATIEELFSQFAQQIGIENVNKFASLTGLSSNSAIIVLALVLSAILIWSLVWKAIALWMSAKKNHKFWFVLFFVLIIFPTITVGILEILYIYVFSKVDWNKFKNNKGKDKPVRLNKNLYSNKVKKKKRR